MHLHHMLSLTSARGTNMISISAPNGRRQPVHPPAPVRDLGPRAIQRLMALKREEQEQELEDYENLKMTEEQRRILEQTFFSVKFEVADLDGLSWASPNGRYMLQRWYTSQVPAIREQLDLSASDNDEIDYDEYMDCEPPPSSASDSTIIPDREDIPSVDIEPPSPPPTARTTHIPPPLVWPTAHSSALSLRSTEIHTPRSPRSPSTPLSPGALRRCRGRAYAHALRRTSTHRVFSVPTCSSPLREKTQLGGCDAVSLGHTDIDPTPPATTAEEMPEPQVRQLAIESCPPAYGTPTLEPVSPHMRTTTASQRFTSMLIGLGDIPIPPPLERTFNEYPEGSWTPDEIIYHSLGDSANRGHREESDLKQGTQILQSGGGLATKLAGLRIAFPDLSAFSLSGCAAWGGSSLDSDAQGADINELMPPLRRMGFRRGVVVIEDQEDGGMPGDLSLEA